MTEALLGTAVAGLLVVGFALAGEALLGRASRDLFGWNESFLIGAGASAAALFPLSLAVPTRALDVALGLIALGSAVAVARRVRRTAAPEESRWSGELAAIGRDPLALALLAAILGVLAFFAALNIWYGHGWDSVQVSLTRARLLVEEGGLSRRWFPEDAYDFRLLAYPPLVPYFEALFARIRGGFDFDWFKPIFAYFYVSLLLGTYGAARRLVSRRWALATVLLVALLPELTMGAAAGGYVDMPMAAFVAAVVAASLRIDGAQAGWRCPLPWLLGAMTTIKQEGMILALVTCAAIVAFWMTERPRRLAARIRSEWTGAAVILAFVGLRVGYVRWIGVHDTTFGPFDAAHFARALANVGVVVSTCARLMLDPRVWGLFWPAFLVSAAIVVWSRQTRPILLVLSAATVIALDSGLFLFTNWDFRIHILGAYARLLAQLAPAAAVVIVAAASRIWSPPPGKAA